MARTVGGQGRRGGWSTRDVLVIAAISVGVGLAVLPVVLSGFALQAALGPLGAWAVGGLYFLPMLLSLYVVRRPGAGLVSGLIVGLVQAPLNPFGWLTVLIRLVFAVGCELPFFLTRYRTFGLPMLMAGGATGALAALLTVYLPFGFLDLAPLLQAGVTIVAVVSGASLGGLLAKLLGDALARTGVLSGYPIGRERRGVE